MTNKIFFSNEIGSAFLSDRITDINYKEAFDNPEDFLKANYNLDFPNVTLKAVENNNEVVNLTLPYYDGLEAVVEGLADKDLSEVSGGEVFFTVLYACAGIAIGVTAIGSATTLGLFATKKLTK